VACAGCAIEGAVVSAAAISAFALDCGASALGFFVAVTCCAACTALSAFVLSLLCAGFVPVPLLVGADAALTGFSRGSGSTSLFAPLGKAAAVEGAIGAVDAIAAGAAEACVFGVTGGAEDGGVMTSFAVGAVVEAAGRTGAVAAALGCFAGSVSRGSSSSPVFSDVFAGLSSTKGGVVSAGHTLSIIAAPVSTTAAADPHRMPIISGRETLCPIISGLFGLWAANRRERGAARP
jgi:hypothetical protein